MSKYLCEMFRDAGVSAEHLDGYMDVEERAILMTGHDHGEITILSCSQLLNTGWDSPKTSVLIDAYPTRSPTVYQQRIGRIMRTAQDKDFAVVLDHAGNFKRFGPAEDMVPESLDDGEKKYNERDQLTEKKEPKVRNCPSCGQQMAGLRCGCGYEVPMSERLESDDTMLEELTAAKKKNREWTGEQKSAFLGELHLYAQTRGFKPGWASNKYRDRFGVWPNKIQPARAQALSDDTSGWIKHSNIKWARRRTA
jgi:superfamily II DNA or RNA helicase